MRGLKVEREKEGRKKGEFFFFFYFFDLLEEKEKKLSNFQLTASISRFCGFRSRCSTLCAWQ